MQTKQTTVRNTLLEAAKKVLLSEGYGGLSTRAVAEEAGTQMSQIRYYFGSKEGMVLAMFECLNEQLVERQTKLFHDRDIPLWRKWEMACDYLDTDLESGYVRVLQELIAVSWSNPVISKLVNESLTRWRDLHIELAEAFQEKHGSLGPFDVEDIGALVVPLFIGAEACILSGCEKREWPIRRALRRIGKLIRKFEAGEPRSNS